MPDQLDHDAEVVTHLNGDDTMERKVFATGLRIGKVVIAAIDNMLVAFPAADEPDTINFGAYIEDVITNVDFEVGPEVALVFYNPETRRFE